MRLPVIRLLDTLEILFVYPQLIHTALGGESLHTASYPANADTASIKALAANDFAQLPMRS